MKKILFLVGTLCFIISMYFTKSMMNDNNNNSCGRVNCHGGICPYISDASEGTKENPLARKQYEWMKFRNPITMIIPKNIHSKEIAFVNSLQKLSKSSNSANPHQWQFSGPFGLGGRTRAIALDFDNENIFLAGGVSGGIWKTTNGGSSWYKTTAPNQIHNVSCVVQNRAPGKRNIWYYGTGEGLANTVSSAVNFPQLNQEFLGDGIFKSTNNGESWTVIPSTLSGSVNTKDNFDFIIEIETFGTDGVMAATSNGVFLSTNGGDSWNHVLNFGNTYNSSNIEITDNGTFYAAIGGEGSNNGVYKSTNGTNWQKISNTNFPTSVYNTVIALAPSNQNLLYCLTSLKNDQLNTWLYKYDGTSWTDLSNNFLGGQASTYGGMMQVLKIKPDDPNTFFIGTIGLWRSINGGQTYELIGGHNRSYVDQQQIIFSRNNPNVMIIGNDGGIWKTDNNMAAVTTNSSGYMGIDWISLTNNLRSAQFYTVAIDHQTSGSNVIMGGLQDRGQYVTRSNNATTPWDILMLGDGGYCAVSNGGEYLYFSMAADNFIMRYPTVSSGFDYTLLTPTNSRMASWMSPMILDPHDSKVMYLSANNATYQLKIWRNSDLTQVPTIWPPTPTSVNWSILENVAIDNGNSVTALGMSMASPRRLYYSTLNTSGSTGNGLFKIENPHQGQPVSQAINFPTQIQGSYLHCICVDPYDVNKITACFTNYGIISIYHSVNGGSTWTPVAGNLEEFPDGSGNGPSVKWISVLYVQNKPIYFAATSTGLFSTTRLNGMNTVWAQEGVNTIGNVPVDMVDVRQSDGFVVVGTMGNGVYSTHVAEINTPQQVAVSASCSPGNGGTINGVGTYDVNSSVTLTATPNTGYRFLNWTENGSVVSTNSSYTFTLNNDRNLIANFERIPSLTTSADFITVSSEAGAGSFMISNITGGTLSWNAVSNASWLTITRGNSGNINGSYSETIEFNYEANATDARIGIITITSDGTIGSPKTFEVRQATATDILEASIPNSYQLFQNYPNPFNPETVISYQLPVAGYVTLKVYDVLGNEVATLVNEFKQPGFYKYQLSIFNYHLSSGVYYYRLTAGRFTDTKKFLFIK